MSINVQLLKQICELPGAPGFEKRIRDFVIKEVTPLVDEVQIDNLGNVYAIKKAASNPEGKKRIYTVVGYICETDTFGVNRQLPEVREGDIIAFRNAGAYCMMMASNDNSRYRPAEVLIHEGQAHLIRRRETLDDLLSTQIRISELAK